MRGDSYDQIASHLRSVQPRLQKWISQEQEEEESEQMDRLLLLNDLVNQVWERYQAFKKGDFSASVHIDPSIDPSKGGSAAVPTAKITDLISFEDEGSGGADQTAGTAAGKNSGSLLDDFEGLTFGGEASTSTNTGAGPSAGATPSTKSFGGLPADLFDSSKLSQPPASRGTIPGQSNGGNNGLGNLSSVPAQNSGSSGLGQWGALQLPMNSSGTSTPTTQQKDKKKADPFEDLLG